MRIKLDENLPLSLVGALQQLKHDIETVPAEELTGRPDPEIWRAAQDAQRLLITQDLDFSDLRLNSHPVRNTASFSCDCEYPVASRWRAGSNSFSEPKMSSHGPAVSSLSLT